MKIVLLGYMASGKSTIGKILSEKIGLNFIDLDAFIESKEEKSVSEIFKDKGEIYFRKQEHFYLKELLDNKSDFVLALGGGTPCYAGNIDLINRCNKVVSIYLKLSIQSLYNRLQSEKSERPLVAEIKNEDIREFIAKHLFERSYYYNQAQLTVNCDNCSKEETTSKIIDLLS